MQIPKAQKDSQVKQLFVLLGYVRVKAAHKYVDEIDPAVGFICQLAMMWRKR